MIPTARDQNHLLEQAVEAIVPVLGVYASGTAEAQPDVEAAIDRPSAAFADRIVSRWHDWLKQKPPQEVLQQFAGLSGLTADQARQNAADLLDRHLLDVRPADRSFALDYLAGIPGHVKQVLVFDRASGAYHLPPDWSLHSIDGLVRFLPVAGDMKLAWARNGPRLLDSPQVQTGPDAPRTVLPVLNAPLSVAVGPQPDGRLVLQNSPVVTKLRLLARCHQLARWALWKRLFLVLLALPVCIGLSIGLGFAVYWSIFDNPQRHAQHYQTWGMPSEYFVRGKKVSQQEYDYFLATNSNAIDANIAAVSSAVGLFALTFGGWIWFVGRQKTPVKVGLEEQIQAITEAHPEEVKHWGGPSVLHHRGLVDELLRIEDKGGQ